MTTSHVGSRAICTGACASPLQGSGAPREHAPIGSDSDPPTSATLSCADAAEAECANAAEAAPELPSFCLCMLLTDCPNRWRPRLQLEARMNLSAFTWYDLVGVLPGASADQIRREYDSKARLAQAGASVGSAFEGDRGSVPGAADARCSLDRARRSGKPTEVRRSCRRPAHRRRAVATRKCRIPTWLGGCWIRRRQPGRGGVGRPACTDRLAGAGSASIPTDGSAGCPGPLLQRRF